MQLVLDIGNTRTKFGLFQGDTLLEQGHWEEPQAAELLPAVKNGSVKRGLLSFSGSAEWPLPNHITWLQLGPDTPLPFKNAYGTPHSLGRDRMALVAGAQAEFPGKHCLVVDLGTCITFDFLEAGKVYQGGAISPGWRMRLHAMHEFTARLPLLEDLPKVVDLVGKTTEECMYSGVFNGILNELEGVINHYRTRYPDVAVVLTGGDHPVFAEQLKNGIFARPFLQLNGLNRILMHNF